MEVDTEHHRMFCKPCDYDHVKWCVIVAHDVLTRRISEISKPWRQDIEKMNDLLKWKTGCFMRPVFEHSENGLTAYQCFWDWDTKGVSLPKALEDPELLADLVQSKRNREFTIDQWIETHEKKDEYMIWPEEYLEHPGMDVQLFKKLFGREPNERVWSSLVRRWVSTTGVGGSNPSIRSNERDR